MYDESSTADDERLLRERKPTSSNVDELRELMARTRQQRREWIHTKSPDATTILRRWPRLTDVTVMVSF